MKLSKKDIENVTNFYLKHLGENGTESAQTLNWTTKREQLLRFKTLVRIADLNGKSILDVGCGLADFYGFLQDKKITADYFGIDLVPEFVIEARKKYHRVKVALQDFSTIAKIDKKYDFMIASGSLSYTVSDNDLYYKKLIRTMYDLAGTGIGFNMLDDAYYTGDEVYAVYNAEEILDFCKSFAARAYLIRGYSDGDFTVFLYKNPKATFTWID